MILKRRNVLHEVQAFTRQVRVFEKYVLLKIRTFVYICNGTTGGGWGGWLLW